MSLYIGKNRHVLDLVHVFDSRASQHNYLYTPVPFLFKTNAGITCIATETINLFNLHAIVSIQLTTGLE